MNERGRLLCAVQGKPCRKIWLAIQLNGDKRKLKMIKTMYAKSRITAEFSNVVYK